MKQVSKFYLASFLKNQTYFIPILVIFFQDLGLSFTQIFWVFTIGSAFSFLIEIPTGVIADIYGNRISIIWSKFLIFVSFILFAISGGFIGLLIANLVYELGKSFRSGTETAFVYNYLDQDKEAPRYTVVKVNQKFYARISESAAALLGGFVAAKLGFSIVFYLAAIPAFINFIQTLTWEKLERDNNKSRVKFKLFKQWLFIKQSFQELKTKKLAIKVIFNIALFSAAFAALDKFIQPYMKNTGIDLEYFGLIYSIFLILVAFLVKFTAKLEDRLGADRIMNYSSFISLAAVAILTFFSNSILSVGLFFLVLMIDNLRSPIANTLFHEQIEAGNRATMGSILELVKSVNKLWVLPLIGYLADIFSMKTAIGVIGVLILINAFVFWVSLKKPKIEKALV